MLGRPNKRFFPGILLKLIKPYAFLVAIAGMGGRADPEDIESSAQRSVRYAVYCYRFFLMSLFKVNNYLLTLLAVTFTLFSTTGIYIRIYQELSSQGMDYVGN